MPPCNYAIQIKGANAQTYQLTRLDGVMTVAPSPAVKSENLHAQVIEIPRTTLTCTTVTQPVLNARLPPAGSTGIGPIGSVTVMRAAWQPVMVARPLTHSLRPPSF